MDAPAGMVAKLSADPVATGPGCQFESVEAEIGEQRICDLAAGDHAGKQVDDERGVDEGGEVPLQQVSRAARMSGRRPAKVGARWRQPLGRRTTAIP